MHPATTFVLIFLFSFIPAMIAEKKNRGFMRWYLLSAFLLTPLLGILLVAFLPRAKTADEKRIQKMRNIAKRREKL